MGDGWLEQQELRRSQYRSPRRDRLRGVIVVHTSEGVMDTVGPDTGAENVADFIVGRTDPGSYHDLVDSDSVMHLVDYDDEAFHDGTGSNRWSFGLAFACRTSDWAQMTPERRTAFLTLGARQAVAMAAHVKERTGIIVPAKVITKAESDQGATGFIAHGARDPKRRTDPGTTPPHLFPWDEFLRLFAEFTTIPAEPVPPSEEDDMYTDADRKRDGETRVLVEAIYNEVVATTDAHGRSRMDRFARILTELDKKG